MDEGEGGDGDEDADSVLDERTCQGFLYAFTFATADFDDLASSFYLGNQLGLTTTMVGGIRNSVGVVGQWRGKVHKMAGLGEQSATMTSTSCIISILDGCLLPASIKQEYSQLFSTFLGNQLGNTIMVGDIQAGHWVGVGCSCGVGVCGMQCQGKGLGWREGIWVGAHQHQEEVAASWAAAQHQWGGWGSNWARAATLGGS